MTVEQMVDEALRNAAENDCDMRDWPVDDVVDDLVMYDADLEISSRAEIEAAVRKWQGTLS